ncbi:MAG: alkaline phosphatase [Bacteroidales bacterium]
MKNILFITLFFSAVLLMFSCQDKSGSNAKKKEVKETSPQNIIFLIGDGMGLQEASLTFYYSEKSVFSDFKHIGLIKTSSASHKITDSGAGNTAFSIGEKTFNGAIGVTVDSMEVPNISERLAATHRIGVLATSSITHATPAAFYAHVNDRNDEFEIARQLLNSPVDFFAAGGYGFFNNRPDGLNLLDSLIDRNFHIDTNDLNVLNPFNADKKYGFLLADEAMPKANKRGDFLVDATRKALEYFDRSEEPFFMMIESSQIDWAGHYNDNDYMVSEVLDFQKTIEVAKEYAEENKNTLVVVTADHETGGYALSTDYENNKDYDQLTPSFATGGHTASLVPVYAFGPGAENFTGIYENSDIFHKLIKLTEIR